MIPITTLLMQRHLLSFIFIFILFFNSLLEKTLGTVVSVYCMDDFQDEIFAQE